ncbi:uncharacterized protein SPAPADRAFT_62996 [Spathaspora passalidarum NRRL Y-27907]|uniref:Uncharacterized protein n=1 Tax=Spathaspora passalidarum (strain NRRL Y-27907 / 11-Y1) TaxID=619300 RepID=G3ASF1_SPAPN|nr:uncharacterized protein SPAPADRAFT_62996 [Spathaspora passalidarum NRRL Y-27907]EGW31069.1 hypothetical protein SPAPADRAFT_62996 [Spathaspora passalidarum NRRL Y-27907]
MINTQRHSPITIVEGIQETKVKTHDLVVIDSPVIIEDLNIVEESNHKKNALFS